jgi:DNA-binding MarR family transcriptional regulator
VTLAYDLLRELKCATVKEVAQRLGVAHTTAWVYLQRLVRKGFAVRSRVGRRIIYCVPSAVLRKYKSLHAETCERIQRVLELLRRYGCVSISWLMRVLGVGHSQAYYLARVIVMAGGAKFVVGKTAVLCRDRATAEDLLRRLREMVHKLAVENRMRYATASKILRTALQDGGAYELLGRFVPLRRDRLLPTALAFIDSVLRSLYGEPLQYSTRAVYVVTEPRVGHGIEIASGLGLPARCEEKEVIMFSLSRDEVRQLDEYAAKMGTTRSAVIRYAIARMLERLRAAT